VAFAHLVFNVCGAAIFYPLRSLPMRLTEKLAEVAVDRTAVVITYILAVFYVAPAIVIFMF
jgi:Na+/phosphate symporter